MSERKDKFLITVLFIAMLIFIKSPYVYAETDVRRIEENKLNELRETELRVLEGESRLLFDFGGWLNYLYRGYEDSDNNSEEVDTLKKSFSGDFRFWVKATLRPDFESENQNEHSFYLRVKNEFTQQYGDDPGDRYDNDGPHLDNAYFILDFSPIWIETGRKYFNVGRGISYSDVSDGIQLNYLSPGINLGAFISHTLPHQDNLDTSVPGYDKSSDRFFAGLGFGYAGVKNHQFYGYIVSQKDFSDEDPVSSNQYNYDSTYFGVGAVGKLTKRVDYWLELIKEKGQSFVFSSNEKKSVDAWAGDIGVTYSSKIYGKPKVSFEYAYGSGDADRASVTNTEDGNTQNDDEGFLYFGYFPSGLALSPRLSNLHMIKFGIEFNPFQKIKKLKDMNMGIEYYKYYKDRVDGGIYDSDADQAFKSVGSEIDFSFSWDMLSDVSLSVDYGYFMPGKAYSVDVNDCESYLSVSLTHTF